MLMTKIQALVFFSINILLRLTGIIVLLFIGVVLDFVSKCISAV